MKITHVLGHNSNWSIESYLEQGIGDYFLITAYNNGTNFLSKKSFQKILNRSMIDFQFYGKKSNKGKLSEFSFHPSNAPHKDVTNVYFETCVRQAIDYQIEVGFENIIIPHFYENESVNQIVNTIKNINKYIKSLPKCNNKFFMTLPFANHIIIDNQKVEEILFECTHFDIVFDGYFVVCENKPEFRKKVVTDLKVLKQLSRVLKTLKSQQFQTIYAYANWDAILFLANTDIDYVTIGTYENLRNFDIKRYVDDESGGSSKGYYFSEKLLNMVKADDITLLRETNTLKLIQNDRNIFSDIILQSGYDWNIHKPDVNKNYLLAISRILNNIAQIRDYSERKKYVTNLVKNAIIAYDRLEEKGAYLTKESSNYHLNIWKSFLSLK